MRRVHTPGLSALGGALVLLAALAATAGVSAAGWLAGMGSAAVVAGCLGAAMTRHRTRALGPADQVTLARAVLVAGVAALAASGGGPLLVTLSATALLLDAVDGFVARRTGTASELGARFDLEVDALLLLVLSAYIAPSAGWWVLAIGLARYAFVVAGRVLPWLRATLPPRRWCKVVAAIQGIVLTVAAAGVLPLPLTRALLVVAVLLLAESFGREVRDLRRRRDLAPSVVEPFDGAQEPPVEALAGAVVEPVEALAAAVVEPVEALAETVSKPGGVGGVCAGGDGFDTPRRLRGSTTGARAAGGFDTSRRLGGSTTGGGVVWTVLAVALLWSALLLPDRVGDLSPATFAGVPVEGLVLVVLVLALPSRSARLAAVVAGAALGLLTLVRLLDMGFRVALDRPFDPVTDPAYAGPGASLLADSVGRTGAVVVIALAAVLTVGIVLLLPLAALRVARLVRRHPVPAFRVVAGLAVVWTVAALTGIHLPSGSPVAASASAASASAHATQLVQGIADRREFARTIAEDRFADVPAGALLTRLRGKDVLVVFVESYGRVALDGSMGGTVRPTLEEADRTLASAGFASRSGYLTSPTFGGASWLAHSTLQSGVWADSDQRYRQLLASDRLTLSQAFGRAGWRTVGVIPADKDPWPEGQAFYGYDKMYDASNLGYAGPKFGYARMPDQYTLLRFWQRELADPEHAPLMAEVDLVSSHHPWAPIPRMVGWDEVGDGSVYDEMAQEGPSRTEVWSSHDRLAAAYLRSVRYSLNALVAFTRRYGDDDLVLVVLGDHQPTSVLTGDGVGHDVPVSIVARDPAVLRRLTSWGWRPGLDPGPDGAVSRMDGFRDRFLTTFSTRSATRLNRTAP